MSASNLPELPAKLPELYARRTPFDGCFLPAVLLLALVVAAVYAWVRLWLSAP